MKYAFILLFSLFYYAQHVSSGGWRGGRVRKLRKLTKEFANLEEDLSCLKEDVIECNKESKELNDKITKLQTILSTDCGSPKQAGYEFDTPEPNTKYCATVKVACAVGYKTSPEKTSLRCQANGKWEEARGCTKIHCGVPSKPGYAFGQPDPDTRYNSTVSVSCAQCFEGQPDKSSLTCEAGGNWADVAGCNKITCGQPVQKGYEYGVPDPDDTCGSTVSVKCVNGFVDKPDKTSLSCQANGSWETPTGCKRTDCGTPSKEGYKFSAPDPNTLFEGTVNVSCADCYEGSPDKPSLSCNADGNWTDVEGCTKTECGSPPDQEGYIFGAPAPDDTCGSTVSLKCSDGYIDYGFIHVRTPLTCQGNGSWTTPSGCKRINCGTPKKEGYTFSAPDPNTLFESTVNVSCADCYEGSPDKPILSCNADGNWTDVGGCTKTACGQPVQEGYEYGALDPDATCGSNVSVNKCANGFVDKPDKTSLSCQANGSWETPTGCERTDCGTPSKEGYKFSAPGPDTLFESTVNVSCADCYEGSPDKSSVACKADGNWTDVAGCIKTACGSPADKDGYVFDGPDPDDTCGSTVTVKCANGYVADPVIPPLTCQAGGSWTAPTGCKRINCRKPSQKEGYVFGQEVPDTRLGSIVTVKCADGYERAPSKDKLTCLSTGNWETVTDCKRIHCAGTLTYTQCDSWGFKLHKCPIQGADVILNAVVARKDSVSQCTYQGAGIAPANYPENMATLGLLGHMNNEVWVHSGCRAKVSVCHTDCGPWYLAYHHNHLGHTIFGNKTDLIDRVRNGANVRVMLVRPNAYVTSLQNAYAIGNELCAQALFHVSKAGYDKFQQDAFWWFVNVCTTGHLQMTRYNVGQHHNRGKTTKRFALKWFARKEGQNHLMTVNSTGTAVAGSKSNVVDAIKQGHHVRVSSLTSSPGNKYKYSYQCDALEQSANESLGVCTALWSVSQRTVVKDGHQIKDFQPDAYWWFILQTTNNDLKMSRWYVGKHTQPGLGNTEGNKAAKWHADPCWQPVYKHDASGHLISGSLMNLIGYIKAGHRVKVQLRHLTLEADEITIRKGHVCVSLLNDLSKSSIDTFDPTMSWVWRQCCTTGRCETMKYQVGANVETGDNSFENVKLAWFADTPRRWTHVLSVAATNSTVTFGSKKALTDAIRKGSEVRYNLVNLYPNLPEDLLICHLADNLAIDEEDVGAMHIRSISVKYPATETEVSFHPNPFWWFTIITTKGILDRSQWTVGVHQSRGHKSSQVAVDWFVNEAT